MRTTIPFAFIAVFGLAGCPDPAPTGNPARLWLALDGSETMVRLVPEEPDPY